MRDRIPINKDLIPYTFNIMLADTLYTVKVNYNAYGDYFTIGLYDENGGVITNGEKVVYGRPLFTDIFNPQTFPSIVIEPLDESADVCVANWDTFEAVVFLTIDDEGGGTNE